MACRCTRPAPVVGRGTGHGDRRHRAAGVLPDRRLAEHAACRGTHADGGTDKAVSIANGVEYQAWTFGDEVPGPVIHVRQGQTINVTYVNRGTMEHSLDFHAAITPPNLHYAELKPGEKLTYSFVANVPGAFVYHCGTPPVLPHMGDGMYGAIVVDPATPLPPASASYVIVQSEWYTQQISGQLMGPNYEKMLSERADEVVFNGVAFQYRDRPLPVAAGERVRSTS